MKACLYLILSLVLASVDASACVRTADMPAGFKLEHYRSPTPACVPNGITLQTSELQKLIATDKPILIDVFAVYLREDAEFGDTWLLNDTHDSLPQSIWLPNVGLGVLSAKIETWFKAKLVHLTQGNQQQPLVFFCVADCWMSWNAVQRAHDYGYTRVYWYKDGVDAWKEAGLATVALQPEPIAPE